MFEFPEARWAVYYAEGDLAGWGKVVKERDHFVLIEWSCAHATGGYRRRWFSSGTGKEVQALESRDRAGFTASRRTP